MNGQLGRFVDLPSEHSRPEFFEEELYHIILFYSVNPEDHLFTSRTSLFSCRLSFLL